MPVNVEQVGAQQLIATVIGFIALFGLAGGIVFVLHWLIEALRESRRSVDPVTDAIRRMRTEHEKLSGIPDEIRRRVPHRATYDQNPRVTKDFGEVTLTGAAATRTLAGWGKSPRNPSGRTEAQEREVTRQMRARLDGCSGGTAMNQSLRDRQQLEDEELTGAHRHDPMPSAS